MERIYKYAIIRLVPHAYRGEQINVGAVIFSDVGLDVRIGSAPSFWKSFGVSASNVHWIERVLQTAYDEHRSAETIHQTYSSYAGFHLSELGWFSSSSDEQYELRVESILADYIDRPKIPSTKEKKTSVFRELKSSFRSHSLLGRDADDLKKHKIVAGMPIGPSGKLHIDFLLKNSCYHATETIDFRHSEDTGSAEIKNAALASITFQHAKEQLGPEETKCYLVYAASSIIERSVSPALQIVEKDADQIFNFDSREDSIRYLDTMLAAAGNQNFFD